MPLSNQSVSHEFTISEIAFRGVPTPAPVFNEFDYHGTLLGLPRLLGESNANYKKRLLDVYVHRANSSYTGLINGITRELGLELFKPIRLTVKNTVDPSLSPRIEFIDDTVYIWSDTFTKTLDISINRSNPLTPEYFITGLVDAINASSTFNAELLDASYSYKRSDTIINQSSSKRIDSQFLTSSKIIHLGVPFIDRGSVVFSDRDTFKTEVASANLVNGPGKFYFDYRYGVIYTFSIPRDGAVIRYTFREETTTAVASPVIIRAIYNDGFQKTLFNQITHPDGSQTNGFPTAKGALIINELLSVAPMYWGE